MFKTYNSTKFVQWQTLLMFAGFGVFVFLVAQFFLLGADIEGARSHSVKMNITEIIAQQQRARLQNTSFASEGDIEFSEAAERASRIINVTSTQSRSSVSPQKTTASAADLSGPEYKAIRSVASGISLVGIISHDSYSVAIIQRKGSPDPQVLSEGDMLADNVTIAKVLDDSVILQSTKNKDARMEIDMSGTPLIGTGQASSNFLNLPTGKKRKQ